MHIPQRVSNRMGKRFRAWKNADLPKAIPIESNGPLWTPAPGRSASEACTKGLVGSQFIDDTLNARIAHQLPHQDEVIEVIYGSTGVARRGSQMLDRTVCAGRTPQPCLWKVSFPAAA